MRFYVENKMEIGHWDIHVPVPNSILLDLDGFHIFEIEHFEGRGFSTLDFRIEPASVVK